MATINEQIRIDLTLRSGGFRSGLRIASRSAQGFARVVARVARTVARKMTGAFRTVGRAGVATFRSLMSPIALLGGAAGLGFLAKQISNAGSAFEETEAKFLAVFKNLAKANRAWVEQTAKALGRSRTELLSYMGLLQDTFVPLGFAREEAAKLSRVLTELAIDVASFNNKLDADVIRDFQSAIVGNTENVRKYGISILRTGLNQELLNMGVAGGVKRATEAQKAHARLALIVRGSADAIGDAARTAGSFANTLKRVRSIIQDVAADLGVEFNSKILEVIKNMGGMEAVRNTFKAIGSTIVDFSVIAIKKVGAVIGKISEFIKKSGGIEAVRLIIRKLAVRTEMTMDIVIRVFQAAVRVVTSSINKIVGLVESAGAKIKLFTAKAVMDFRSLTNILTGKESMDRAAQQVADLEATIAMASRTIKIAEQSANEYTDAINDISKIVSNADTEIAKLNDEIFRSRAMAKVAKDEKAVIKARLDGLKEFARAAAVGQGDVSASAIASMKKVARERDRLNKDAQAKFRQHIDRLKGIEAGRLDFTADLEEKLFRLRLDRLQGPARAQAIGARGAQFQEQAGQLRRAGRFADAREAIQQAADAFTEMAGESMTFRQDAISRLQSLADTRKRVDEMELAQVSQRAASLAIEDRATKARIAAASMIISGAQRARELLGRVPGGSGVVPFAGGALPLAQTFAREIPAAAAGSASEAQDAFRARVAGPAPLTIGDINVNIEYQSTGGGPEADAAELARQIGPHLLRQIKRRELNPLTR